MRRSVLMLVLCCGTALSAPLSLDHGVRPDVYAALVKMKTVLTLSPEEFNSVLASTQQNEVAATTTQPSQGQLDTYAQVQALNHRCLAGVQPRMAARQNELPWVSNTLEAPERLKTFLNFTGRIGLKKAEESVQALAVQEACTQAAGLAK